MIVICPACGRRHRLPEDWSANKVRCSRCGEKFYLDELASEFISADLDSHEKAQEAQKPASSIGEHSRPSRSDSQARRSSEIVLPYQSRRVTSSATILRVAVGIAAVLVIAGTTAFYFLHVVPENKFRQALREGQEAENAQRWEDALNAYFRAEQVKPHDPTVGEMKRDLSSAGSTPSLQHGTQEIAPEPESRLIKLRTVVEWKLSDLPKLSEPTQPNAPAAVEERKHWIMRYVLGKLKGEDISVDSFPEGDESGWWCSRQYEAAAQNPAAMYRTVGRHLALADYLLSSGESKLRRAGLGIAIQASLGGIRMLKDKDLAVAIVDEFVAPNLDACAENPEVWLGRRNVIEQMIVVFAQAKEETKLVEAYKLLVANAPNKNVADSARFRAAVFLEKSGQFDQALQLLKEIDSDKGMSGARNLIPRLERKLAQQKNNAKGDE